ncbi:MAG TPA: GNAT family N-acetyltransferase [Solirubrobacteraceae bacterium]|jgi:GNAT superfamily N-acetyltransferase|nr:GNAT family N-acetyltransferase [Solirubrobacteraceae bacterium]
MRRALADGYELDDDPARIDVDAVHAFLSGESYWARGRAHERIERAIEGSRRVLGLYLGDEQVGFARAVSDGAIMAYLADVYVLPAHRGRGLGLQLVREMIDGGDAWDVRWLLHTADAQGLYAKLGFVEDAPAYPLMERARPSEAGGRASGTRPQ